MAGLLDFNFDDPQNAGLLALAQGLFQAGAPSTRRIGFGEALTGGLSNMAQAQQYAKAMQQKKLQDQQAMEMSQFKFDQMKKSAAEQEMAAKRQAAMPELIKQFGNDYQGMVRAGVPADFVKQIAESQNWGKSKVARTLETEGQGGAKMIQQFDDYGNPVGQGLAGYVAPVQVNTGDKVIMTKPMAGQSFNMGMSPSQRDSSAQGWAGIGLQKERLSLDKETKMNPQKVPMTATLQKELLETDDVAQASKNVINALQEAKKINDKAYSGWGANTRASIMSNLGGTESADATVDLNNLTTGQALESLKVVFGGMPTEGERKILMEMQASADKTPKQRAAILDRAIKLAETRGKFADEKAQAIRSGKYLTEGVIPQQNTTTQKPKSIMKGQVVNGYKYMGGDPANPNSWEQQ